MSFRKTLLALLLVLLVLLAGCTTDGLSTPSPTETPGAVSQPSAPALVEPSPTRQELAPVDATPLPEVKAPTLEAGTPAPYTTATLQKISSNCLRPADYQPIVNGYIARQGYTTLKDLWEAFDKENPVYNLMSSLTDVGNTYAIATTYSKMLLLGEYKIAINRPDAVGYAHCAVLVYMGGDEPEVGVGITDATLNDTWSGFAYGNVRSEPDMRAYIRQRIGKPVIVRYHVTQDPRDVGFVRTGFFSPTMRLLWLKSYYTRFAQNPDMLKNSVDSPRGPSMKIMMELLAGWPEQDLGVFIDYIIDPIL